MKRLILLAAGTSVFGFLGWSVPALAQTTVTLQQGQNGYTGVMDTYIDEFLPTDTFGGIDRLEVRYYDPGTGLTEHNVLLLRFELSSIPSTATITGATLKLYNTRAAANGANDVVILEKALSAWNNQWTWAMGVPSSAPSGVTCPSVASYSMAPTTPELYTITGLGSLVQGWVSTPGSNLGLLLSTTSNLNFRVASSEYSSAQYRPSLEITYTTGGPPPTLTVTAPPATTAATPLSVSGTASASSPATLTSITWSNAATGGSGSATGTNSWTASIPLARFSNDITITATDSTGATSSSTFTVTYSPPRVPGAGGGSHKACGFGSVQKGPGSVGILALALALLILWTTGRPARSR